MSDTIKHEKYRVYDGVNEEWKRISFWTDAADVSSSDGRDLQTILDNMEGIQFTEDTTYDPVEQ